MIQPEQFLTHSLKKHPQGAAVCRILAAAIAAVEPAAAVQRYLKRDGNRLILTHPTLGERAYNLSTYRHIYLVAVGKASLPMIEAVAALLGSALTQGIAITKQGNTALTAPPNERIQIYEANHPVPDQRGMLATLRVLDLLKSAQTDDLVLCLISGGGSALLTAPAPGITLDELGRVTSLLLACGAPIQEFNTLRKNLDIVKGGRLARIAAPAQVISLIISDVDGDPLDRIASGPTAPDPSTYTDAYAILRQYKLVTKSPLSVLNHLSAGMEGRTGENPKPNDPLFQNVQNVIIANNQQAAQAALAEAQQSGFNSLLLTTHLHGEARNTGGLLASILRQMSESSQPVARPGLLVAGGETTVTLRGSGLGGRNQETALAACQEIAGLAQSMLICLGTDGDDGPTAAAGAVVTGETYQRAMDAGLAPELYLANNDSYHFFEPLDDLLRPGPTMTNVNDLNFLFAFSIP